MGYIDRESSVNSSQVGEINVARQEYTELYQDKSDKWKGISVQMMWSLDYLSLREI